MAIYHLSVKTISRSAGRSATSAAAYRSGSRIIDERTGEIHDFTRKRGVLSTDIVLPDNSPKWAAERAKLWNTAEASEKRKNSTVAREFEIALPAELSKEAQRELALEFARELVKEHGCAADVAIHKPNGKGDQRNVHAHILLSTRRLGSDGFGEKTRELDDKKSGPEIVSKWRERFAEITNQKLLENDIDVRVDHRSLEAQGIDRLPTQHLGPAATGYERRTGEPSRRRIAIENEIAERLLKVKVLAEQEQKLSDQIIILSNDIAAARAEKERQEIAAATVTVTHPAAEPPRPAPAPAAVPQPPKSVPQPPRPAPAPDLQPAPAPRLEPKPAPQPQDRKIILSDSQPPRPAPTPQAPQPQPAAPFSGEWKGSTLGNVWAGGPALVTIKNGEASIYHDHQRAAVALGAAQTSKGPALRGTVCYPDGHSLTLIIDLDDKQGRGGYGIRAAVKDRDGRIIETQAGKVEPLQREINLDRTRGR